MKAIKEMEGGDFHIIAWIAHLVATLDGFEDDIDRVKRLAYDMYERRKETGRLTLEEKVTMKGCGL